MRLRFEKRAKSFNPRIDYVMTDERGEIIFEAICTEWKAMTYKDNTYEFVNHVTGEKKTLSVSHEYKVSGVMIPDYMYTPNSSNMIDIDGMQHWEYLRNFGVTVTCRLNGSRLECEMFDDGQKVGQSVNDTRLLGKMPLPDRYTIEVREEYLEAAFMVCFISASIDWIELGDL